MNVSQRSQLDRRLRRKTSRETALADVSTLFKLLPGCGEGGSNSIDFTLPLPDSTENASDYHSIRKIALRNSFLKKFKGFTFGNPRETAKQSFLGYERRCRDSNVKLRALRRGQVIDPYLQSIMLMAQRKISRVLGDFDVHELLSVSRWGPGVTSSTKGPLVASAAKFASRPDVTRDFLSRARLLMPALPSWSALLTEQDYGTIVNPIMPIVKGNKITFVSKTAKTHRTIAVEPHINVYFQNGLGRMIRRRMKYRAQVDLNDQTLNQRLARLGSLDDSLATLDLEGASDTICIELVRDLVPEVWFNWLNAARSQNGELDGEVIRYEKFSSMGNGATFDLESLIFWALSSAVVELEGYNPFWVNVFGDDIIVPSGCFDRLAQVLDSVGLIVNRSKSFGSGPFRESCGKDWFLGYDVRPVYLKDIPDKPIDWIILANQIRRLAHNWGEHQFCHSSLKTAYEFCLSRVPKEFHVFKVPLGYDLKRSESGGYEGNGLISNFDEACPSIRGKYGWDGWHIRALAPKALTVKSAHRSLLTAGVFHPSQGGNDLPLRERFIYREVSMFVPSNWHDLGPWGSS